MKTKTWQLAFLVLIALVFFFFATPMINLSTVGNRINLWSGAEIRCDDLSATFFLGRMPATARLFIDTDPAAPRWPFYFGGITQVLVNDRVVKSYDPPLLDRDTLDVVQHLRAGFNGFNTVKVVFQREIFPLCSLERQALFNGYVELQYPSGGGGGGDGGGGWDGIVGGLDPMIILVLGIGMMAVAFFLLFRGGRRD